MESKEEYNKKVKAMANELYEKFERDLSSFINSRLRAVTYCERQMATEYSEESKLFWLDVKTELNNKY